MKQSVRKFPAPHPPTFGKSGWCKWCGEPVKKPSIYWHSSCADEYNLHTRPDHQFAFLVNRDGLKCACCQEGVERWSPVGNPHRLVYADWMGREDHERWAHLWKSPGPWESLTPEDRQIGLYQQIERIHSLQVDHRVPLWSVADLPDDERRVYFGPSNLWLLCHLCHKAKTAREAKERAGIRSFTKAQLALAI